MYSSSISLLPFKTGWLVCAMHQHYKRQSIIVLANSYCSCETSKSARNERVGPSHIIPCIVHSPAHVYVGLFRVLELFQVFVEFPMKMPFLHFGFQFFIWSDFCYYHAGSPFQEALIIFDKYLKQLNKTRSELDKIDSLRQKALQVLPPGPNRDNSLYLEQLGCSKPLLCSLVATGLMFLKLP